MAAPNIAFPMTGNLGPNTGKTDTYIDDRTVDGKRSTFYLSIQYYVFFILYIFAGIEAIAIGIANTHSFHSPVDRPAPAIVGQPVSQHKSEKKLYSKCRERERVTDIHLVNSTRTSSSRELAP